MIKNLNKSLCLQIDELLDNELEERIELACWMDKCIQVSCSLDQCMADLCAQNNCTKFM